MKNLIINADDFGWNSENDKVMIRMLLNQTISSVSVIVNGNNIMVVRDFYLQNKHLSLGLHLNLTEGISLTKQNQKQINSSLIGSDDLMLGKMGFRQALKQNIIKMSDIDDQIRLQIDRFIDLFGQFPKQIDGHQHVHIIPIIANSLARIMTQEYGIYKTRLIEEKLVCPHNYTNDQILFYEEVIEQSKQSRSIYDSYRVFACTHFMGLNLMGQNLSYEKIESQLQSLPQKSQDIEWMCHVGKKNDIDKQDQFYNSQDREYEAQIINSLKLKQILDENNIRMISFNDLKRPNITRTMNIMLYSQMIVGTGNFTTCLRIQSLLMDDQVSVFLRNINSFDLDIEETCLQEIENIRTFSTQENIGVVLGINMFRTGIILQRAFGQCNEYILPYVLMIAGTDANIYMKDAKCKDHILKAIQGSFSLISLNQVMIDIVSSEISKYGIKKNIILIPQSVTDEQEEIFSFRSYFSIPQEFSIILLPASFRVVKDIEFVLLSIHELFQSEFKKHIFLILGPILDQDYFDKINRKVEQINIQLGQRRIILGESIKHSQYIYALRRECNLLINCSLNEGVCSSILEALKYKIPVLVRDNEGNKSIITHLQNGLLFNNTEEFCQCFVQLMNSQNLVDQLTKNGYDNYCQSYSPEYEQMKLRQVMNEAIEDNVQQQQL